MKQNVFNRWVEGMKNLTPAQQLHAQIVGTYGSIFGIIFASIFLFIKGLWYFVFILVFTIFLQVISLIGLKQKYKGLLQVMEAMQKMEVEQDENN